MEHNQLDVNKKKYPVDFRDLFFDGEYLWGSARQFNALVRIKMSTWEAQYIDKFPDDNVLYELHGDVYGYDEELIFIPVLGNQFDIYNKKNGAFECIKLQCPHMNWNFLESIKFEHQIMGFPLWTDKVVIFDLKKRTEKYITGFEKGAAEGNFFRQCVTIRDGIMYAVSLSRAGVCTIEVESGDVKWISIDNSKDCFSVLLDDGIYFWMVTETKNRIVRWNVRTGGIKYYEDFPNDYKCSNGGKIPFCNLIDCGNRILAVAIRANMSVWIDKETGKMEECKALNQSNIPNMDRLDTEEYRFAKKIDEDKILIMSCRDKAIVVFSILRDKVISRKQVWLTNEEWADILSTWFSHSKTAQDEDSVIEEGIFSLRDYIKYLCD